MKRVFPVIAFLITLSLIGLIFFQYMWLKSAKELRTQQLYQKAAEAVQAVGQRMISEQPSPLIKPQKRDILLGTPGITLDFLSTSFTRRYTIDELKTYVKTQFAKDEMLKGLSFEVGIVQPGNYLVEPLQSSGLAEAYIDSTHNFRLFFPLVISGTDREGLVPEEDLLVIVRNQQSFVLSGLTEFIVGAVLFTLIIALAFFITIRTLIRQKKLSEIKNDFINNMTHEFKTPLATISLAVDALKNEKVVQDKEKMQYFTNIIKEENKRMNKQVETILQAALLDKNEVQLNLKIASAHHLIESATNNISLPIEEKGGKLIVQLGAAKDTILADEVHFTNLINSMLDNAVKYSKEVPVVKLTTSNSGNQLRIQIEDEGIGMNRETLSKIFEKFYRAHTGNVHNVKGFGLGLSYVKTMVDAHKGTIKADSTVGKGSTFTITIPLAG